MYIEMDLAMRYLGGSKDIFAIIKKSFIENYSDYESKLEKLYKEKDFSNLYNEVHSLKGITLNLGAQALYDNSVAILAELKEKKGVNKNNLDVYLDCFNRTYQELANLA